MQWIRQLDNWLSRLFGEESYSLSLWPLLHKSVHGTHILVVLPAVVWLPKSMTAKDTMKKNDPLVAMPSQSDVTALPIWRIQKLSFFLLKYTTVQLTRKVYFISIDRYFFSFHHSHYFLLIWFSLSGEFTLEVEWGFTIRTAWFFRFEKYRLL